MKKIAAFCAGLCGLILLLGCAAVTITVDLDNPYPVTMIWNGEALVQDPRTGDLAAQTLGEGGALVEASVKDSAGVPVVPDSCEWYMNGKLYEKGIEKIFINSIKDNLAIGNHQLSLVVQKDTVLSSARVQFTVPGR